MGQQKVCLYFGLPLVEVNLARGFGGGAWRTWVEIGEGHFPNSLNEQKCLQQILESTFHINNFPDFFCVPDLRCHHQSEFIRFPRISL